MTNSYEKLKKIFCFFFISCFAGKKTSNPIIEPFQIDGGKKNNTVSVTQHYEKREDEFWFRDCLERCKKKQFELKNNLMEIKGCMDLIYREKETVSVPYKYLYIKSAKIKKTKEEIGLLQKQEIVALSKTDLRKKIRIKRNELLMEEPYKRLAINQKIKTLLKTKLSLVQDLKIKAENLFHKYDNFFSENLSLETRNIINSLKSFQNEMQQKKHEILCSRKNIEQQELVLEEIEEEINSLEENQNKHDGINNLLKDCLSIILEKEHMAIEILDNEYFLIEEYKKFFEENLFNEKIEFEKYLSIFLKLQEIELENQKKRETSEKQIDFINSFNIFSKLQEEESENQSENQSEIESFKNSENSENSENTMIV